MQMTLKEIEAMSYPDFVGFIGQKNTPPGGSKTVEKWIKQAEISEKSHLLDLACSTGFSSRSTVKQVGCTSKGLDISKVAIETAIRESREEGYGDKVQFFVGDACYLPFSDKEFSHVLAGSTFGFIQDRANALAECRRVLKSSGHLCIGNFYYTEIPSENLLDTVSGVVGFRPESKWSHKWWSDFFSSEFDLQKEENEPLPVIQPKEIADLVRKFIYETSPVLKTASKEIQDACFRRLYEIRLILNEHRRLQGLNISIWVPK